MKKFIFFSAVMMLLSFTSCNNSEVVDEWGKMVFVSEEATIDGSGSIAVPAQGGTYHVRCTNSKGIGFEGCGLAEDGHDVINEEHESSINELTGAWTKVDLQDDVLTVTLSPNNSKAKRKSELFLTSGPRKGLLIFNQAAE